MTAHMWVAPEYRASSGDIERKSSLIGSTLRHAALASIIFKVENRFRSRSKANNFADTIVR
jgi:hypothetical protein